MKQHILGIRALALFPLDEKSRTVWNLQTVYDRRFIGV